MHLLDYAAVRQHQPPAGADFTALSTASPDLQAQAFAATVLRNPRIRAVLERLAGLDLPPWYLTAGALFQTVWNTAAGHADLHRGIRDLDLFFFDDQDLSYEAEDVVIKRCLEACHGLGVDLEPRNQARVHLWYEAKFGKAIPAYRDLEHAISSFAATCCSVAIRLDAAGRLTVHATHGFDDLFALTLRPSPTSIAPREIYETKAARYCEMWPMVTKLAWPSTS